MNKDKMNKLKIGRPTSLHFTFNIDLAMTIELYRNQFQTYGRQRNSNKMNLFIVRVK